MKDYTKILLTESEMPKSWYNIQADLSKALPAVLHPGTKEPVSLDDLAPIFAMELIKQEMAQERYIDIPEEVQEVYKLWRPTPLLRAKRLEKVLGTPAKIYYKYEGTSPVGSHKLNTAVPQAYYNKIEGTKRISTETGAGQWGCAMSFACSMYGMECKVYMVKVSFDQKPYRRSMMQLYGASVTPSPSNETEAGRKMLAEDPNSSGSLGGAISEAVEDAVTHPGTKYTLGSVLNHVLLHQTVIGQEAMLQMEKAEAYPDIVIGCTGGGSNFGGVAFPFVKDKLAGRKTRIIAVEPESCPSLTKGQYCYDFGDVAQMTPLMKMYTLGHTFVPAGIHAGGLRYHGMSPIISALHHQGIIEARAVYQTAVFEGAALFIKAEGLIPAPESAHALRVAIDEALACKISGEEKVILFNMSGHGLFDMGAYDRYMGGQLEDFVYPREKVEEALSQLPSV